MNKKKVGELEGIPIVTGEKNYANEHEYYLTMNEDNTYLKLELRVSGDKFRLVLGGGSNNYPTATAGDVNKVWQVTPVQKGTKAEEIVIVPEQTLVDGLELEYNDKFVPGTQCVAVVNGVEYRGEVVEDRKGNYAFEVNEFVGFGYSPNGETFQFWNSNIESHEVTAKLSIIEETPIYDYNWAPGVKIPIPTAEDKGKILVVNEVEVSSKEYELAPTQTVTVTEEIHGKTLQNTSNLDKFVEGATITVVIDNTIHTGIVVVDGDELTAVLDNSDVVFYIVAEGLLEYFSEQVGTYEVSVSVLEKEYSYEYLLQENSGNLLRMPDNIVRLKPQGNDFKEYYCYYESLEPLPSGIYLTTFNPNPGDTYYDIYQVMYNADLGTALLLSPLVVNDGGEVSVPTFNHAVNNSNNQGNFYLIVCDARNEEGGFLIKIGYSEVSPVG